MTDPLYAGEAWCKSWADGSTSGRVVTFQIEEDDLHPFRGYQGERFHITVVPIGNDDQPIRIERKAKKHNRGVPSHAVKVGDAPTREDGAAEMLKETAQYQAKAPSSPAAKSPRKWHDLPPSSRAALLCKEPEFWAWLEATDDVRVTDEPNAAIELKCRLDIKSRAEIVEGSRAAAELSRIIGNYRAWQTAKGHGVAT